MAKCKIVLAPVWQRPLCGKEVTIIFGILNFFIYEPIFKIFVALFTTFGLQKDDNIIFVCACFRTR